MVSTSLVSKPTSSATTRDTFRMARDAAARASFSAGSDSLLQAGIDKLRRFLASGEQPSKDAPRGYYLNIVV